MKATREDYGLVHLGILVAALALWLRAAQLAVAFWAGIAAFIAFMVIVRRSGRSMKLDRFQRVTVRHLIFLIVGTTLVLLFAAKMRDIYDDALSEPVNAVE